MTQSNPDHPRGTWQLLGNAAELDLPGVQAAVELVVPHKGVSDVRVLGSPVHGHLLGMKRTDDAMGTWGPLTDRYERGEDLVAVYNETESCPFRATLYWRARGRLADKAGVVLDLIVSLQTSLLDATPEIQSCSCLSDAEVLLFPPTAQEHRLDLDHAMPLTEATPNVPIGCVMLRLAEVNATYCEMIHPTDWRALEMRRQDGQVEIGWSLLGHFMEKGVIRRLRVRGHFLNGRAKEHLISDLYADFAGSPPPLAA